MVRVLSESDQCELDAFRRYLAIVGWRMNEIGESRREAVREAGIEVYGDENCEGNKHRQENPNAQ